MTDDPKKAFKKAKENHGLHVSLIQYQEQVSKADALVWAYKEGVKGLENRLKPQA